MRTGRPIINMSRARDLIAAGCSMRKAAEILGVHHNTFRYRMKNSDAMEVRRRHIEAERANRESVVEKRQQQTIERGQLLTNWPQAAELLSRGMSVRRVARELGIHHNTLYYRIRHHADIAARLRATHEIQDRLARIKTARLSAEQAKRERAKELLQEPSYTLTQIAILVETTSGTLRRWIKEDASIREARQRADEVAAIRLADERATAHTLRLQARATLGVGRFYSANPAGKVRVCVTCLQTKPLAAYYFKKQSLTYRHSCIECERKRQIERWHGGLKLRRVRTSRRVAPLCEVYPYLLDKQIDGADLVTTINSLVPRTMDEQYRADFCQELVLAVLSGEVALENLRLVLPQYLKEFKKHLPSKYTQISLDAPLYHDGNTYTLADVLTTDADAGARRARIRVAYGAALADCEGAEDLSERLRGAWDANRLKGERVKTYSEFHADHREDMRPDTVHAASGKVGMYVKTRRFRFTQQESLGRQRGRNELEWATYDYEQKRLEEERENLDDERARV